MDPERSALKLSAFGSVLLGTLGIVFAWLTGSTAILLDGFFSMVGFIMALLTLKVSRLVKRRGDDRFHFGYSAFSPLINTVKAMTLLGVCGFALASAVGALLAGGRALNAEIALVYAGIAAVACFAIAIVQRRAARRVPSDLLAVEVKSWFIDGALSLLVGVAFIVAILLESSSWSHLVPYVDPGLVVLLVSAILLVPLRIIWHSVGELVVAAPAETIQAEVQRRFDDATRGEAFSKSVLRMMKMGPTLYVQAQILVSDRFSVGGAADLDRIRGRIFDALHGVHPNLEVDTLFTAQERWLE